MHFRFILSSLMLFIILASFGSLLYQRSLAPSAIALSEKGNVTNIRRVKTTVVIQPIFTQAAYGNNGFYSYYFGKCDKKCLTVPIPNKFNGSYVTGGASSNVLLQQNYSHIDDIDIDKNPDILKKYDVVILLHNEYVTKKEFDAITHHVHVIYLYPNALFAQVKVDYNKNTITLMRGHWYPNKKIVNGFDWKFDNTKFELNTKCNDWHFHNIDNGIMLDCYPEYIIQSDKSLLHAIRNYFIPSD
ncbi:hypothetical protein DYY66_2323 [Candidatus Nitrosotalea sp. FS]|nr:hypothetical protein [Candidatus Nitrosotalea sp. FS]